MNALMAVTTGSDNVALGQHAGDAVTTGSDNIMIANTGGSGDTGVIRIGIQGTQTKTTIAGRGAASVLFSRGN